MDDIYIGAARVSLVHGPALESLGQGLYIHANAQGVMGAGLQAELRRAAGGEVERELRAQSPLLLGSAYLTSAGKLDELGVKAIAHGVIAREPGGLAIPLNVERALADGLQVLEDQGCRSVTVPQVSWQYGERPLAEMTGPLARVIGAHLRRRSRIQDVYIVSRHADFLEALECAILEQPGATTQRRSHEAE